MLRDLRHSVSFEIAAEIGLAHDSLLASNLGKKASTNLGAIHTDILCQTERCAGFPSLL
jgi:protein-disulfide isomerase-like protein with CxxC motif